MKSTRSLLLAYLVATAACAEQAGSDYQGEPLITLHGSIVNTLASEDATVILQWDGFYVEPNPLPPNWMPPPIPTDFWNAVPVEGQFPAAFTIDVYTPPPADDIYAGDTLFVPSGQAMAKGGVVVVHLDESGAIACVLGAAQYALFYFPDAVTDPGSVLGTLSPGYHLFQPVDTPDPTTGSTITWVEVLNPVLSITLGQGC